MDIGHYTGMLASELAEATLNDALHSVNAEYRASDRVTEWALVPRENRRMVKLTKKMHEVLKNADLALGEINDVPMSTMYGLEARRLVSSDWRKAGSHATTTGGAFPKHSQVKLTAAGLRAARSIQGLRRDL